MASSSVSRPPAKPSSSYKRTVLSLDQRMEVIAKLESGLSTRAISVQMGCGKTQIQAISRDKLKIKEEFLKGGRASQKHLKRRRTYYEDLNQAVWEWYLQAREDKVPITGASLQRSAVRIAAEMGVANFAASNGWLQSFKTRHNILRPSDFSTDQEIEAAPSEQIEVTPLLLDDWETRFEYLLEGYSRRDIYVASETCLLYKSLPNLHKDATNRDRLSLLLACSASGERLPPLVIGQTDFHSCDALPVTYRSQSEASLTKEVCEDWLNALNTSMKAQKRHILILSVMLDALEDRSNVKLVSMPSSNEEPPKSYDAEILRTFKAHYKTSFMRHALLLGQESVGLRMALRWCDAAWSQLTSSIIKRCFYLNGFMQFFSTSYDEDAAAEDTIFLSEEGVADLSDPPSDLDHAMNGVSWEDYIMQLDASTSVDTEPPREEQEKCPPPPQVTYKDAIAGLDGAIQYAEDQGSLELIRSLLKSREDIIIEALRRQTEEHQSYNNP